MFQNDNMIKDSRSISELQRILSSGSGYNASKLDLPDKNGEGFGLEDYPLAMVYSPMQEFDRLYDLDKGFEAGTVFSELDLPFSGRSLKYKGNTGGCYDK